MFILFIISIFYNLSSNSLLHGVLEALEKAKRDGKVRFVGFSGHKDPNVHLEMINRGFPFDTVQMPLNPFDAGFHSFEKLVLPELNKCNIAYSVWS